MQLTVIDFATNVQNKLPSLTNGDDIASMTGELESQIKVIKSSGIRDPGHQRHQRLDSVGTSLWNICTRVKRLEDGDSGSAMKKMLTLTRVFAFLLLSTAQPANHSTPSAAIRLSKLAIKTGRSCIGKLQISLPCMHVSGTNRLIEHGELESAYVALQKAADYNGVLQTLLQTLPEDDASVCNRLEAEYLALRTALVSHENCVQTAAVIDASKVMERGSPRCR